MATEDLVQAFLVGRNAYLTTPLAYQGFLDQATSQFRCQIAPVGSQVWADWLTVDASGNVAIPSLSSSGLSLPWSHVTGTPTTLAGYGVASPLDQVQGGTGTATPFTPGSVVFQGASGYAEDNVGLFYSAGLLGLGTNTPAASLTIEYPQGSIWVTSTDVLNPAYTQFAVAGTAILVGIDSSLGASLANDSAPYAAVFAHAGAYPVQLATNATVRLSISAAGVTTVMGPLELKGYTVATLPAGAVGQCAYATDLLAPGFLVAAVGGGAVKGPVFYNGAAWVAF